MKNIRQFLTEKLYKEKLNPKFWNDKFEFDPKIKDKIIRIVKDYTDNLEITQYIKDITLTGSIANYNYTKFSDIDVHILIDFEDIDSNVELVKSDLNGKRFIWNLRHEITFRGHEMEIYFQSTKEPLIASGVYSFSTDKWIKIPKYSPPLIDVKYILAKAANIKQDIDMLQYKLKTTSDPKQLERLQKRAEQYRGRIIKMRRDSLHINGEYGNGNLVFKQLRNSGYIKRVIDISNLAYDKGLSESRIIFHK